MQKTVFSNQFSITVHNKDVRKTSITILYGKQLNIVCKRWIKKTCVTYWLRIHCFKFVFSHLQTFIATGRFGDCKHCRSLRAVFAETATIPGTLFSQSIDRSVITSRVYQKKICRIEDWFHGCRDYFTVFSLFQFFLSFSYRYFLFYFFYLRPFNLSHSRLFLNFLFIILLLCQFILNIFSFLLVYVLH